jgi:DNA-binding MarR family transcriptional regulator
MKREETIDFNIKASWHAIYRMYNQEAIKYGFTITMAFVLLNIDRENGTPAMKIAPLMGMEARSLTRVLKSMEKKGLICRKKHENDGRSVRIFLTTLGNEKQLIAKEKVKIFNAVIRDSIPEEKITNMIETLTEINKLIEQNNIFEYVIANQR